jgi:hypothetical protein
MKSSGPWSVNETSGSDERGNEAMMEIHTLMHTHLPTIMSMNLGLQRPRQLSRMYRQQWGNVAYVRNNSKHKTELAFEDLIGSSIVEQRCKLSLLFTADLMVR